MSLYTESNNKSRFNANLANPKKIKIIAGSRMKNDDVNSEMLTILPMNSRIPKPYAQNKRTGEIRRI
ncbi:MAG: hypothetical protein QXP36_10805 [Conexivisphaerales archaeon]